MNKRKKRVLFSYFFTGWLAAAGWEWQDQPWLVNYFNSLISISTNVLWLLALCEIVTYSMFNGCSASILVISIGVFSFRAELQIETTQDYATDSWFFNVFTGSFSLRTLSSPFGVFARIHVTAARERRASMRGGKRSPFPHPSRLRRSLTRFLASCTKIGEQWKYFTDQRSQRPYNTLRSLLLFLSHHKKGAREENAHACAFRVSRCLAPFSLAARILREAFLCLGVVCFVSLL